MAYVFVHILPGLGARQRALADGEPAAAFEHHVELFALVGFGAFYGLEKLAHRSESSETSEATESSRTAATASGTETGTSAGVFWFHIGAFATYNAVIGYLLVHREEGGPANLAFFAVAMALHFLVNDHSLRDHHRRAYDDVGRWVLAFGSCRGPASV